MIEMANNSDDTEANDSYQPKLKTNITLEKNLVDEVKDFIDKKKQEDATYPHKTPTALIREAIRTYIFPEEDSNAVSVRNFENLLKRVNDIEKDRETMANRDQEIYLRCVAMLINLFDKNLDFFESFDVARKTLAKSNTSSIEFHDYSRSEIENFFLSQQRNPPKEFSTVQKPLFHLLMMFLFLCHLGYTRKQDVIDPMGPMSQLFLDTIKKMNEKK